MLLRELAQRRRISESGLGGDPAPDDPAQGRPFELARVRVQRMAAVAFLVGALAPGQIGGGGGRGRGPAAGRQRGGRDGAGKRPQVALPVFTTMIRLVPDSGR